MSTYDYRQPSGPRSGFWLRFAAAFIDGLLLGVISGVLQIGLKGVGYGLGILVGLTYYSYFEGGRTGYTPGKRVMGIRVVDFETGAAIGYGRGFIRYVGRYVSAIVFFLGYFWMLWDREKQCWHDKFAGSVVVPLSAYPVGTSTGTYSSTGAGY
jgi:uncharacterized RDD family membrane protein YckC